MTLQLSTGTRTAIVTAVVDLIDSGGAPAVIEIYSGSQPAMVEDAATGDLLAVASLDLPSFMVADGAAIGDTEPTLAVATGTAGWFRLSSSTGTRVLDGHVTAGGAGGVLELSSVDLVEGGPVVITSLSLSSGTGGGGVLGIDNGNGTYTVTVTLE